MSRLNESYELDDLLVRRATWDETNSRWQINLTSEEFKKLANRTFKLKTWSEWKSYKPHSYNDFVIGKI